MPANRQRKDPHVIPLSSRIEWQSFLEKSSSQAVGGRSRSGCANRLGKSTHLAPRDEFRISRSEMSTLPNRALQVPARASVSKNLAEPSIMHRTLPTPCGGHVERVLGMTIFRGSQTPWLDLALSQKGQDRLISNEVRAVNPPADDDLARFLGHAANV